MANPISIPQNFSTTLNVPGNINASQTTGIILTSVTGLPTDGGILCLDWATTLDLSVAEYIEYTGISGSTLTGVTRGAEGSTGHTHNNGATVVGVVSQAHIKRLRDKLTGNDLTVVQDTNNNAILKAAFVASAVNQLTVTNAATLNAPSLAATGTDTNIDLNLITKGTGILKVNGAALSTTPDLSALNAPQGFVQNGKIVVSVASNNLTVALKGLDGTDPSGSNKVYIRIGNTVRTITAALSVTKNAGTNWFDSGSGELATIESDYFVYLGYNATDGATIGFARIPWATQYSDFSTTSTNAAYGAISTITTAASTDNYENVGRFAATLSATAAFTWTVPTFTPLNQIQVPVYETRWLTWAPVHTGFSSGPSGYTTKYKIRGAKGSGEMTAFLEGTTGGTSNATTWTMTLPYPTVNGNFFTGYKKDNGGSYAMAVHTTQAASKVVNLYAGTSLGDGWTASGTKNAIFPETIFQLV